MRIRTVKREDGKVDVHVQRTRKGEKKTRPALGVSRADLSKTIAALVEETRGRDDGTASSS